MRATYRAVFSVIGLLLPGLNTMVLGYLDQAESFGILFNLSLGLHMILLIPGLLLPLRGMVTLLLESIFWGSLGYLIGRRIDNKAAQPIAT